MVARCGAIIAGLAWLALGTPEARAQTLHSYQCADGSQFAIGIYPRDTHAYLQLDGKSFKLAKRLSFSGARYRGSGITLFVTSEGAVLKRRRLPSTACTVR